jgi:hypothetical protein
MWVWQRMARHFRFPSKKARKKKILPGGDRIPFSALFSVGDLLWAVRPVYLKVVQYFSVKHTKKSVTQNAVGVLISFCFRPVRRSTLKFVWLRRVKAKIISFE